MPVMAPAQGDSSASTAARSLEDRVWRSLRAKDTKQALAACEQLNREHPDYASGWHTASQLALRLGNVPAALAAIDKALQLDPDNTAGLLQRAICVGRLGDVATLERLVAELATRELTTTYQHSALGSLYTQLEQRDKAVVCYERAAALEPARGKHHYNIAALRRSLGDIEAAEAHFDKAIELDPEDYEAVKVRSELRRQTPENNHVAALEAMLDGGIADSRGEVQVCYAAAKELEDLGKWERSFSYLKRGADKRRSLMRYDVQRDIDTIAAIEETFSAGRFDGAAAGSDNDEAIFIVGMPRTGTTLVERILGSHSQVYSAGELGNFATVLMQQVRALTTGSQPPRDELVRLSAAVDFRKLGDAYVESTRPFTGKALRFIDKLPLNFLYAGLIHLALPRARIINLKRHPLDTCYAVYKQLFVDAYPYSYDLAELGRYYAAYERLMRHWSEVLPGVVHTVEYESLVADFEPEVRRLLAHCGLAFEDACLRFHENSAASTTASTVQVRQPVYRSSVGKWRRFSSQLEPLIATLEDEGIALE
jgi:tetratricopeptide (TPR) repeat protein